MVGRERGARGGYWECGGGGKQGESTDPGLVWEKGGCGTEQQVCLEEEEKCQRWGSRAKCQQGLGGVGSWVQEQLGGTGCSQQGMGAAGRDGVADSNEKGLAGKCWERAGIGQESTGKWQALGPGLATGDQG